jgi:DNA-binding transcriptional LysR family regulator
VAALEEALGTTLFLRTREGLKPSAAAERLRAHAERVEAEVRGLAQAAASRGDRVAGVVRLATTEALGTFLVQEGLLELRRTHPDLVIELLGGNRPVDIARGEAEIALRVLPLEEDRLKVRALAKMRFGLYGSSRYLAERGRPARAEDLAGHDLLVPGSELAHLPEAKWLAARTGARIAFRTSSMATLVAACVAGQGLTVLPRPWAAREPALEEVHALDAIPTRTLWLVVHPDVSKRPEVRLVVEQMASLAERFTRV